MAKNIKIEEVNLVYLKIYKILKVSSLYRLIQFRFILVN